MTPDTTTTTPDAAGRHARAGAGVVTPERLCEWSDPEPRPCKWCDSEGVLWLVDGGTEPCPECNGLGVIEHGF